MRPQCKLTADDLYSKNAARPDPVALKPYYEELIAEFFPDKIRW
jgi:inositol oxygenase